MNMSKSQANVTEIKEQEDQGKFVLPNLSQFMNNQKSAYPIANSPLRNENTKILRIPRTMMKIPKKLSKKKKIAVREPRSPDDLNSHDISQVLSSRLNKELPSTKPRGSF